VLGFLGGEGLSLEEYSKGFDWVFLPLLRRVSQDTSYVLMHGVSSCDLGCCNIIGYGLSKMLKWNELHT
jgi:hypothetical protein